MSVRTRFAPSPTGYLHIGGVRTALFNWLFARQHGGQFLLRVDDTDQQRNVEAALAPILHGFRWLGLDWDEGPEVGGPCAPYYQSQRSELYSRAVESLLATGHAYRDFATTEEIQIERDAAQNAGVAFTYSRKWEAKTSEQAEEWTAKGRQSVVRLRMPREGELVLHDLVRGEVRFAWANEQDHVIQRTDGTCLYHLASVVDDQAMQITHVIRAEEHLSNTPRQVFIAQSLGYSLPQYAHLPYVAEPGSKNKLSKRKLDKYLKNRDFAAVYNHGLNVAVRLNRDLRQFAEQLGTTPSPSNRAEFVEKLRPTFERILPELSSDPDKQKEMELLILNYLEDIFRNPAYIESYEKRSELLHRIGRLPDPATFNPVIIDFYEQTGYLADAILNYLLLLGWSLDGEREDFTRSEMIDLFSLERVVKSPASFDPQKLMAFQDRAMQRLPEQDKLDLCTKFLSDAGIQVTSVQDRVYLGEVVKAAKDRIKVASDVVHYRNFFVHDGFLVYNGDALKAAFKKPESRAILREYAVALAQLNEYTADRLEIHLKEFVARVNCKIGDLVQPLRVAVTGESIGFSLFDALAILGVSRSLQRIETTLANIDKWVGPASDNLEPANARS